jgi:hypothetical protein
MASHSSVTPDSAKPLPGATVEATVSAAVDKSGDVVAIHAIDSERLASLVAAAALLRGVVTNDMANLGDAKTFEDDIKRICAAPAFCINPCRHLFEGETRPSLARSLLIASLVTVGRAHADVCCVRDCCLPARPTATYGDPDHCSQHLYSV